MCALELACAGGPEAFAWIMCVPDIQISNLEWRVSISALRSDAAFGHGGRTCGPSGVLNLHIEPAGTFHALPLRGGMMKSWVLTNSSFFKFFNLA